MKPLGLLLLVISLASCRPEDPQPQPKPQPNPITLECNFLPVIGLDTLVYNRYYQLSQGDSIRVTKFNVFISNLKLLSADQSVLVSEPESYHLIRTHQPNTQNVSWTFTNSGTYYGIRLDVGVDSARNCSGVQSGNLDPAYASDMYWSWTTGYIFLKLEGNSPQSTGFNQMVEYHIGGFSGINKTQKTLFLMFPNPLNLTEGAVRKIKFHVDINPLFNAAEKITFNQSPSILSIGPKAASFSKNFPYMIRLAGIQ